MEHPQQDQVIFQSVDVLVRSELLTKSQMISDPPCRAATKIVRDFFGGGKEQHNKQLVPVPWRVLSSLSLEDEAQSEAMRLIGTCCHGLQEVFYCLTFGQICKRIVFCIRTHRVHGDQIHQLFAWRQDRSTGFITVLDEGKKGMKIPDGVRSCGMKARSSKEEWKWAAAESLRTQKLGNTWESSRRRLSRTENWKDSGSTSRQLDH